ncbi:MAG TPA: PilZ domain-containing protein [bacterium]|nr:PilZ domain-containing protein [bacterium]
MAGAERRNFVRIPFWFVARYRSVPSERAQQHKAAHAAAYRDAYGKNLSVGGILIETEEHFPLSTLLEIELDIPSLSEPIVLRGRVVRSDEIEPDKLYDNGVAFESIDDRYRKTLSNFIDLFK